MICILPKDKFVGIRTVPPRQATCFGWLNHPVLAAISWWSHQKSHQIHSAWWLSPTPLKNDGVSWDDDIPSWMEIHKSHVPNHQPAFFLLNSYHFLFVKSSVSGQIPGVNPCRIGGAPSCRHRSPGRRWRSGVRPGCHSSGSWWRSRFFSTMIYMEKHGNKNDKEKYIYIYMDHN